MHSWVAMAASIAVQGIDQCDRPMRMNKLENAFAVFVELRIKIMLYSLPTPRERSTRLLNFSEQFRERFYFLILNILRIGFRGSVIMKSCGIERQMKESLILTK